MTGRYYHTAPRPVTNRVRCLVCHEEVYSAAGIHPQCALRQEDPPRLKAKSTTPHVQNNEVKTPEPAGVVVVVAIPPVPKGRTVAG
jgi:hypothetical protein